MTRLLTSADLNALSHAFLEPHKWGVPCVFCPSLVPPGLETGKTVPTWMVSEVLEDLVTRALPGILDPEVAYKLHHFLSGSQNYDDFLPLSVLQGLL